MKQYCKTPALFALIPNALKLYLPRLPSFLGPESSSDIVSNYKRIDRNSSLDIKDLASLTGVASPEPRYKSKELVNQNYGDRHYSEIEHAQEETLGDSVPYDLSQARADGITWKLAHQGFKLLRLAVSESTAPKLTDIHFARQVYINSLTYLLRALPSNLSMDEQISIQAALPECIIHPPNQQSPPFQTEARTTSFLHRTLALTIVQLFVLFQIVLPYLRLVLVKAWAYEKEHRMLVRFASKSFKLGIGVGEAMKGMGETKTGELVISNFHWLLEGIIGGIGEGMVLIRASAKKDI